MKDLLNIKKLTVGNRGFYLPQNSESLKYGSLNNHGINKDKNTDINKLKKQIRVFPNPLSGNVYIEAEHLKSVAVLTKDGEKIMESRKNYIDLKGLPEGLYFLKIKTACQTVIKKIIHKILHK